MSSKHSQAPKFLTLHSFPSRMCHASSSPRQPLEETNFKSALYLTYLSTHSVYESLYLAE